MNSLVTLAGRRKMAEARAGIRALPKITGMAFGDGAVSTAGSVSPPTGEGLKNELLRKPISSTKKITDACYRYTVILEKEDLAGQKINEIALYDAEGTVILMKTFSSKGKDQDMQMIFEIDDQF